MKDSDGDDKNDPNVFELLSQLRKEKLFITTEKLNIQSLNTTIKKKTDVLIESTWITTKQRLYLLQQREFTTQNYEQIKSIINSSFIEAKTVLGFHTTIKIESLLQILRTQPEQLAKWLVICEQLNDDQTNLLQSIVTGLYSSCIFTDDMNYMLKLLYELAKLQLIKNDNPRRILKNTKCSFRNLYFIFNEVSPTAKIFLCSSLKIPILRLLSYRDLYLDLDPSKTLMRYKQDDYLKSEFKHYNEYRNEVVIKLVEITNQFLLSLHENVYSFPKTVAWIVHQISQIITKSFGPKEANAIITELIFTLYICPAIVDPEQYSICDTQITDIARHNLIQIGQIIHILALNKYERNDEKIADVYNLFDKDIVRNFLDDILFNIEFNDCPPIDLSPQINREIALFTEDELNNLIGFLQKVYDELSSVDGLRKRTTLEEQIASLSLPSSLENSPKNNKSYSNGVLENTTGKRANFLSVNKHQKNDDNSHIIVLIFTMDKDFENPIGFLSEDRVLNMNLLVKKDVMFANAAPEVIGVDDDDDDDVDDVDNATSPPVVVSQSQPPQRSQQQQQQQQNFLDEGSTGNTSENFEAISEAASNHSVASSLELENDQNDNLSDMISANVSGRGTPNISGRDTPSSQVIDNEERQLSDTRQIDIQHRQPQMITSRQIRSEIDDKFCKFEIKKLLEGDETVSVISETWSTDVLASDNETIDTNDNNNRQNLQLIEQTINEVPLDFNETQSESAWSTDVMASDTERLIDVDNDDTVSVAQSDDTNSVARSDDTRSETDENLTTAAANRRLSNSTTFYTNYQMKTTHTDGNANNLIYKSTTTTSRILTNRIPNKDTPGPSGLIPTTPPITTITTMTSTTTTTTSTPATITNHRNNNEMKQNLDERSQEILLSNCSLNSNSSGSSNNSNSFETKNDKCDQWNDNKQWLNGSVSSLNVTSTPSESTSELSVLSVNNCNNTNHNNNNNNINGVIKKSTVVINQQRTLLKPSASTGAIPKSISFDMSADKGDKYLDDEQRLIGNKQRGSFFGKLKIGFRNKRGKSFRNHDDYQRFDNNNDEFNHKKESPIKINNSVSSEDILAKYRSKSFNSPIKTNDDNNKEEIKNRSSSDSNSENNIDINNSFDDIKKKLRLVLSDSTTQIPKIIMENNISVKNKIETLLRLDLGKARNLNQWSNIARLSETIRCINLLNETTCLALLNSMNKDFCQRTVYTQYLISSKQELLMCESYLDGLSEQIKNEKQKSEEYLCMICVKKFLIEQEMRINQFCEEFVNINLSDEKCDLLNNFYKHLYLIMERNGLWRDIFKNRRDIIKITLERSIMSRIYINALYPNGDGDRDRDRVLYQHIEKLSRIVAPDHKDLMIPKIFLKEYPWLPAQDVLKAINAYRTPRDKVNCIVQCAKCIMDLLAFSQCTGSTTADDFTPVLVYVIIMVNPVDLLSTIQFVNNFYQNQLGGEELYWWTQFCSAVEYIKTMDYSD